jgi:hypothetical protein
MKVTKFVELVDDGYDVEMRYKGKTYWAAWHGDNTQEKAFYEADTKNTIVFLKAEEILDKEYNGFKIRDMIESLNEDEDIDY